jgi:hypothetical protein
MHLGQHMAEEQKAHLSAMYMGKPAWNKGIPATDAQKVALSVAHLGFKVLAATKAKISITMTGRIISPETGAKISAAKMGHAPSGPKFQTPETRTKMSAAQMGHPVSLEARARNAAAQWKGGRPVSNRKASAKRRLLGFAPLNSWFLGCEGHHINPKDVIYMPWKLHRSIYHNQYTGQGMAEINALAGAFLTEDWT